MRSDRELLGAAKTAQAFISELLGVHIIIPDTELAHEAGKVISKLQNALERAG
jgi:hypothetical protein